MNVSAQSIAPASRDRGVPQSLALLGLAIFATTWACVALVEHNGRISPLWVSNAILLACLLRRPTRAWLPMLAVAALAAIAADFATNDTVFNAMGFCLANLTEVLIVAVPLRWLGFDRVFSRTEVLLTFYGLVIAACAVSAGMAGAMLHYSSGASFFSVARSWFGADTLGLSLLVPFFMCVRYAAVEEMFAPGARFGTFVLLGLVAAIGYLCYALPHWAPSFLYFPVLILLTFRRGFAGGALGLSMALVVSFYMAIDDQASVSLLQHSQAERIAMVQLYYAVIGFTVILAGATLDERRALEKSLALSAQRAEAAREEALLAKDMAEKASHAKSSFLANMSHELRTPLNAVLGFSEIIHTEMYGPNGDTRYRDYAGLIHSAGTHLLDLIGDILDMSKIEAGKLELHRERVNTAALVRECVELVSERAAAGGVALDMREALTPVFLSADRRALKQIVLNLLSNGIKFTPVGGVVAIGVSDEGALCRLSVSDTGVGISAAEIDRLGNPFVQLSNNSGNHAGTGLGLALVRGLSELHGGRMRIHSIEGQGTTVTVSMPFKAPVADSLAA
ncbi:MAG: ATP-binding protein [Rhizomicrobium sp.]